jgi:hypothetical protein
MAATSSMNRNGKAAMGQGGAATRSGCTLCAANFEPTGLARKMISFPMPCSAALNVVTAQLSSRAGERGLRSFEIE